MTKVLCAKTSCKHNKEEGTYHICSLKEIDLLLFYEPEIESDILVCYNSKEKKDYI